MAKRSFKNLTEREILALAIQLEEEDSRVYGDFADGLRESYPVTAKAFEEMQAEESRHRQRLIEMHRQRFGGHIPLIRRQDVSGFMERRPVWLVRPLGIQTVRKQMEIMEYEAQRFYARALKQVSDAETRKLLGDLAEIERQHSEFAASVERDQVASGGREKEDKSRQRMFVLQIVQPGLAGLMDGSVSTPARALSFRHAFRIPCCPMWWPRSRSRKVPSLFVGQMSTSARTSSGTGKVRVYPPFALMVRVWVSGL